MIYGKKNFINPFKLELGFGYLFRVDKECLKGRPLERIIKDVEQLDLINNQDLKNVQKETEIKLRAES